MVMLLFFRMQWAGITRRRNEWQREPSWKPFICGLSTRAPTWRKNTRGMFSKWHVAATWFNLLTGMPF